MNEEASASRKWFFLGPGLPTSAVQQVGGFLGYTGGEGGIVAEGSP